MTAGKVLRWLVIIFLVVGRSCFSALANPVQTYGGEFDLRIPADPNRSSGAMYDAVIEIPDHFSVYDLDVGISLTHDSVFDLQIFLVSPAGTRVCLNMYDLDDYFEGEDYVDTIFDDESEIPIDQAEPQFTGRFRPKDSLAAFDGQDAYGLWRLQIYDTYYADTGSLGSFELMVTILEPATAILLIVGVGLATLIRPRRISCR